MCGVYHAWTANSLLLQSLIKRPMIFPPLLRLSGAEGWAFDGLGSGPKTAVRKAGLTVVRRKPWTVGGVSGSSVWVALVCLRQFNICPSGVWDQTS